MGIDLLLIEHPTFSRRYEKNKVIVFRRVEQIDKDLTYTPKRLLTATDFHNNELAIK